MVDIKDLPNLVPTVPTFEVPRIDPPRPVLLKIRPNSLIGQAEGNLASEFHQRLMEWINKFNGSLDELHEVGVRLVSFGQTVVFHLENIGYWNPSLISFSGHGDDGNPVELIQHVSQISILLTKLPRRNPKEPKRVIGFETAMEEDRPT